MKVEQLAARIGGAGPGSEAFAKKLVEDRGAIALRALYGMLDLLRRYEAAAVDSACAFAVSSRRLRALRFCTPISRITRHRYGSTTIIASFPEIATSANHFTTLTQGASS